MNGNRNSKQKPDFRFPSIVLAWLKRGEGIRYAEIIDEDSYIEVITNGPFDEGDGYAATWEGYNIRKVDNNTIEIEAGTFGYGGTTPTIYTFAGDFNEYLQAVITLNQVDDVMRFGAWVERRCPYTIEDKGDSYLFTCVEGLYEREEF